MEEGRSRSGVERSSDREDDAPCGLVRWSSAVADDASVICCSRFARDATDAERRRLGSELPCKLFDGGSLTGNKLVSVIG